jgi:hypothetical protein
MQIVFFDDSCKTTTNNVIFGLVDDPAPSTNPAYIDEVDANKWIAEVINRSQFQVDFFPIDHCVVIIRPDGNDESRCDGVLKYDQKLIFVELKDRNHSGWLADGSEQLKVTFNIFKLYYDIRTFQKIEAYVSNKQRPYAITSSNSLCQKFKDDTGIQLKINRQITLE